MNIAAIATQPSFRFWIFASIYGLTSQLFTANFYSWGLSLPFGAIFFPILLLSPFFGAIWIYLDAALLRLTNRALGIDPLANCVAQSKAPSLLLLLFWTFAIASNRETAFIQNASNDLTVSLLVLALAVSATSFCLLAAKLRKIANISRLSAVLAVSIAYLLSFLIFVSTLYAIRCIYIICI